MRHSLSDLITLPTLSNVDGSELKIDTQDAATATGRRVWLAGDEGGWLVIVEEWDPNRDHPAPNHNHATWYGAGAWVETDRYEPEDDRADDEDD